MPSSLRAKRKAEFGDFQTPPGLAQELCHLLRSTGDVPASIVEPTCGLGNLLIAALDTFPSAQSAMALDISQAYCDMVQSRISHRTEKQTVRVCQGDFFLTDWPRILGGMPKPVLVIGNPPWVTNAGLGRLGSANLPRKHNVYGHSGLDAITGKSNFDISEWMLIELMRSMERIDGTLALLCKMATARRALSHAWKAGLRLTDARLYKIDAGAHFGAAVDACFFVCRFGCHGTEFDARIFESVDSGTPQRTMGYRDGLLVADAANYERWKHLSGASNYRWRSGVKHDCAGVMEFTRTEHGYTNGLGENAVLEPAYLFPMLKSSDVAVHSVSEPRKWLLVTQQATGDDTQSLATKAPHVWEYLLRHSSLLDARRSSIYRKRSRFSIFGVGAYSFAPWKIAISGLYKSLEFRLVEPFEAKPVLFDDTVYFLACQSRDEGIQLTGLLRSEPASAFLNSLIFWDGKRPVTADVLSRLDLSKLADELGIELRVNRQGKGSVSPEQVSRPAADHESQLALRL